MVYHLVLHDGYVVAVSVKKIEGSTGAVFTKEYLESFGITVEEDYTAVHHPFVRFRYDESDAVIVPEENTEAVRKTRKNIHKSETKIAITDGISLKFGEETRSYFCRIEDQLTLIQAQHLLNHGHKSVDLRCTISGVKQFVPHNLAECTKVMTAMSVHILEQRKLLDNRT